jgi:hypothetical protein
VEESVAVGVCIRTDIPLERLATMSNLPSLLRSASITEPFEIPEV